MSEVVLDDRLTSGGRDVSLTGARRGPSRPTSKIVAVPLAMVFALVLWELASLAVAAASQHSNAILPSPIAAWRSVPKLAGFRNSANLGGNNPLGANSLTGGLVALCTGAWATFSRALLGVAAGGLGGAICGAAMGRIGPLRRASEAALLLAALLPLLGMVPLFALWFGETSMGVVVFVSVASFLTLVRATSAAVGGIPEQYEEFARSLGAGRSRVFFTCLPAALPELRSGIRAALILGISAEMAGELFGVQTGLGYFLEAAFRYGHVPEMLAIGTVIAVLALLVVSLFDVVWSAATRWHE